MKIRGFDLTRSQRGWVCHFVFLVTTANQFTDQEEAVRSYGRWPLTALWNGWMGAKRLEKLLKAKPGEREAKGWIT